MSDHVHPHVIPEKYNQVISSKTFYEELHYLDSVINKLNNRLDELEKKVFVYEQIFDTRRGGSNNGINRVLVNFPIEIK